MNRQPSMLRRYPLPLLGLLVLAGSAFAQEEAGVEEGTAHHRVSLGFEAWVAQPAGLEYDPANVVSEGNVVTGLSSSFGTETDGRFTAAFNFDESVGSISAIYYATSTDSELSRLNGGNYEFAQLLTPAFFAGVTDDSLSDGFRAPSHTSLRDKQLLFSRPAFRTPKVSGIWSIGWRRVEHRRLQQATYFASISPLPPTPTPSSSLVPRSDFAQVRSNFDGRGLTGGLDLGFNLWRDRLIFEGGVGLAVLRGDVESDYSSTTHFYMCGSAPPGVDPSVCPQGAILGLEVPFDVLAEIVPGAMGTVEVASFIQQFDIPLVFRSDSSATSMAADVSAGFRWRALEWLDARVGFRQTRYTDVGIDLHPLGSTYELTPRTEEIARDATYEGFFFGVVFEIF